MTRRPESLILVFDADSGLRALVLDVLKKAAGREECALCEITYGPLGKRSGWKACERRLGLPVSELHRDELPPEWSIPREELPCILVRGGESAPAVLVGREDIVACGGDIAALEERVGAALASVRTEGTAASPASREHSPP